MLKLLKEVLKVGQATVEYPFVPLEVMPGFRGKPEHNPEMCMACAACTIACPANALAMATDADNGVRTWSISYGRCIFCARCEEVCPTGAIALSPDFELAVLNKDDLVVRADFQLTACRCCRRYFAPAKEIDYVLALLRQAGLPDEKVEERRALLEVCPECKRRQDIPKVKTLSLTPPTEVA